MVLCCLENAFFFSIAQMDLIMHGNSHLFGWRGFGAYVVLLEITVAHFLLPLSFRFFLCFFPFPLLIPFL